MRAAPTPKPRNEKQERESKQAMPITKKASSKKSKVPARQARKSRYAGIKASEGRDPYPNVGEYLFNVAEMVEGHNPGKGASSVKLTLEVVESEGEHAQEAGERVFVSERVSGNGSPAGLARVKSFVMAAAGFEDEDEFDEFDPDGLFIEACLGESNDYSDHERLVVGRQVFCKVTRGREIPDSGGDFFRNYAWTPVEE